MVCTQAGQLLYEERRNRGGFEYVYLGGSLLATRNNGVVSYQHTDALGSPVAVTNATGQVTERTQYEPYGAAIGKTVDGIGYTGHAMDAGTGLVYMQQRYYDPDIGKMLSVDSVTAYDTGNLKHFNVYAYAYNNPYSFTDPDGRQAIDKKEPPPLPSVKTLDTVTVTAPKQSPSSTPSADPFRPQHRPSFFRLTTFEALKRNVSTEQAVENGNLTRAVTLPAMIVTASPSAIALGASTAPAVGEGALVAAKSKHVREGVYYACVGIGMCQGVRPSMQRYNQQERLQQVREGVRRDMRRSDIEIPQP